MLYLHVMLLGQPASEIFYRMTCTGNAPRNPFYSVCSKSNKFFRFGINPTRIERKTNFYESIELETRKLILPQKFPVRLSAVLSELHFDRFI